MKRYMSVLCLAAIVWTGGSPVVSAAGTAPAPDIKRLAGFELDQMKIWFPKLAEKDGVHQFRYGRGHVVLATDEITEGKHAWKTSFKKHNRNWTAKANYTAIRYLKSRIFNGYGKVGQDPRLRKKRTPWLPGDWSGYDRLRLDVKSTKAAMQLRLHLFDQIALPPVQRIFSIPAGQWVTLDLDLARASQLHSMTLSQANQKKYGVKIAKLRTFNPAKMANFMVLAEICEADTDFIMDNLRLVAKASSEKAKFPLVKDSRPHLTPKELPPSQPQPVTFPAIAKGGGALSGNEKTVSVDTSSERNHSYGRLSEMVRHAITSAGPDKLILAQADFFPKRSLDSGENWKPMGNLRHSSNAPGVGVGAAGPDLLGLYVARCHGASLPVDMFFRSVTFDGKDWVASEPYLADINSWHCPEFKVEIIRLKSGRIWAVWSDCDRFNSYHNTLRGRFSDNGGKLWRDPDSNGLVIMPNPSSIGKPAPLAVTWWWEDPKILPSAAKANGHIGSIHPHTNFAITRCGEHLAVIYCSRSQKITCQRFDGKTWSLPQVLKRGFGTVSSATTLGDSEMYVTFKGKVYRLGGDSWVVDGPAEKGCSKVVACAGKVVCVGKTVSEKDGQLVNELWISQKASGEAWSEPAIFATETIKKQRGARIDITAPQFAHDGFVPVAWGPKNGWIKVHRAPVH